MAVDDMPVDDGTLPGNAISIEVFNTIQNWKYSNQILIWIVIID